MQNPTRLTKLTARPVGTPETDHPRPERLIRGNPLREPGHWRIAMGQTERELFTVLEGRCRVHDALGGFEEAGPGEGIYIPPGFEGAFEVLEPLTKTYMICE